MIRITNILRGIVLSLAISVTIDSYAQAVNYYFKGMSREDYYHINHQELLQASEVESITFHTEKQVVLEAEDVVDGHKSYKYGVDLGLPSGTRWASMNLGANSPEDEGDFFMFGAERLDDGSFSSTGRVDEEPGGEVLLSFNEMTDDQGERLYNISGTKYDAACSIWGGKWRMPSLKDFDELMQKCKFEEEGDNVRITGPNGNSILVNGFWMSEVEYLDYGDGFKCEGPSHGLAYARNWKGEYGCDMVFRLELNHIRPIYDYEEGMNTGITYKDIDYVTIHKKDGTEVKEKQANLMQMHFMGSHACDMDEEPVVPYSIAVDLGLKSGNLWAPFNVGATEPWEGGDYFAVGETSPKPIAEYNMAHWKYAYDAVDICPYLYETTDGHDYHQFYNSICTAGDPSMDPAHVNWGGRWEMGDIYELVNECTLEWTSMNGMNGYKVTGPNGNHIFLPAAGEAEGDTESFSSVSHWDPTFTYVQTSSAFVVNGIPGGGIAAYNTSGFYLCAGISTAHARGGIWTGWRRFAENDKSFWGGILNMVETGRTVRPVLPPKK